MIANLCVSALAFNAPTRSRITMSGPTINGWTPDTSKFVAGLPGAISPLGAFDPVG